MRERARELKAEAKAAKTREAGEADVRAAVEAMPEPDRTLAGRLHALVAEAAPSLVPRTWYGMPAYADGAGKVVCFVQAAAKFGTRYLTVGFTDAARLDDGDAWPTAYAVAALTPEVEARLAALMRQAVEGDRPASHGD